MRPFVTKIALAAIFTMAVFLSSAQKKPDNKAPKTNQYRSYADYMKNKAFDGYGLIDSTTATSTQLAGIHREQRIKKLTAEHYYFNTFGNRGLGVRFDNLIKSGIYEGLEQNLNEHPFTTIIISGKTPVEVIAQQVTPQNAKNYLFRVIQNSRKELVGWKNPSDFKKTADGSITYAYLGKFNHRPGQYLKIEIYNTKDYNEQDAVIIDWRRVEAANIDAYMQYYSPKWGWNGNMRTLFSHGFDDIKRTSEKYISVVNNKIIEKKVPFNDFIETTTAGDTKFRLSDTIQNLFFNINNGRRLYNYAVGLKRQTDKFTDSLQVGETNSRLDLNKELWKVPGKYLITFTPIIRKPGGSPVSLLRNQARSIRFTVLPALGTVQMISVRTLMLIIVIILTTAGFMFMMYRDGQKRKLAAEAQNKQIATLQLASVRAQLNPHFIFNALAGIQNLMNKNDVENANRYLARFARLTRNVLDDGNKELVSIEHELSLLNDYLLMEQTRFGFQFHIEIDEDKVDQQIEIPAMLLQPFVENAVKHGVSTLNGDGMIEVVITQKDNTLILAVNDNGKGFGDDTGSGMGIKLCQERIKLLNNIYKNSTILLHRASDSKGTLITIELRNWV